MQHNVEVRRFSISRALGKILCLIGLHRDTITATGTLGMYPPYIYRCQRTECQRVDVRG